MTPPDPLKQDFRNFLFVVWKHLNLPDPTPLQYDIASFLQHGPKRGVVEALRGIGKSWITVAFVAWLLYRNPQCRILVVSASGAHATDFTTMLLGLILEMPLLAHLRPRDDQRSSKVSFDVGPALTAKEPSVKSLGITGQLTGSRADIIIPDDIETATNSDTQAARDKLAQTVKEFDSILKPGGRILYLGTPHIEDSLYNKLKERGYVVRVWPARYPTPDKVVKYGTSLAPLIARRMAEDGALAGQPTDIRFSHDELIERELSLGKSTFALQYMLDTSLSDAERFPLRLRDLIILPLDTIRGPSDVVWGPSNAINDLPCVGIPPDKYFAPAFVAQGPGSYQAYDGTVMYIDPSGRGKDETAYAVVKMLNGRLFLTAAGGLLGGYDPKVLQGLMQIAKRQAVKQILVEPNFGGGMFSKLLAAEAINIYPCQIDDADWSRGQKETRIIDTLEPVLNSHRLVVCRSVVEHDYSSTEHYQASEVNRRRLMYQLTRITRDRGSLAHDDRVEAVAGAVAFWVDHLSRNTEKAVLDHKEDLLDQELEKFMNHVVGRKDHDQTGHYRHIRARGRKH